VRLISAAAILLALAGQQPRSPDQPIKSSVDLVRVDVTASDDRGQPIPDLTIKDFDLRVDGRRRAITSVQYVSVPADAAARPPDPGHYSSNAAAAGGRLIMIAVDRTSITPGAAKAALHAASAFVGSLNRWPRFPRGRRSTSPPITRSSSASFSRSRERRSAASARETSASATRSPSSARTISRCRWSPSVNVARRPREAAISAAAARS
jgi:hypothetical protein